MSISGRIVGEMLAGYTQKLNSIQTLLILGGRPQKNLEGFV